MIPNFPNFKTLELSDRKEIETFATQYQPYSDFNFLISWSWAREWDPKVSFLNGNLVFRFLYRANQRSFYSYLGNKLVTNTCDELFEYIENHDPTSTGLSYVPEISLMRIDFQKYYIEIDINACDYIYELESMHALTGNKYSQKRGRLNHFKITYPNIKVKALDLSDVKVQNDIFELNKLWVSKKTLDREAVDGDIAAMKRFFLAGPQNTFCVGIYEDKLMAYAIYSFHGSKYVLNHFVKADITYKGIYEFLMQESAGLLIGKGYKFLNHLEDLGLEGLRKAKMAYRPAGFLRKYHIKKL